MKGQMNQGHLYLGSPAEHPSPFFDLAVIACTSPSSHATGIVHEWHSGKADCMMLSPRFVEKLAFSLAFKWFEKGTAEFPDRETFNSSAKLCRRECSPVPFQLEYLRIRREMSQMSESCL